MKLTNNNIYQEIKELLYSAKNRVYQTINTTMTETYFQIGKRIVEEEQGGEIRAEYGKSLLKLLSVQLINEFGKGFDDITRIENRKVVIGLDKSDQLFLFIVIRDHSICGPICLCSHVPVTLLLSQKAVVNHEHR